MDNAEDISLLAVSVWHVFVCTMWPVAESIQTILTGWIIYGELSFVYVIHNEFIGLGQCRCWHEARCCCEYCMIIFSTEYTVCYFGTVQVAVEQDGMDVLQALMPLFSSHVKGQQERNVFLGHDSLSWNMPGYYENHSCSPTNRQAPYCDSVVLVVCWWYIPLLYQHERQSRRFTQLEHRVFVPRHPQYRYYMYYIKIYTQD